MNIEARPEVQLTAMSRKIAHITSVHPALDTRIFHKEATSLARAGNHVVLIAPALENMHINGVQIKALHKVEGRAKRWLNIWRSLRSALSEKADIYHLHDPELLLTVPWLKLLTRSKIVYDIHEDVRAQIADKDWVPKLFRPFFSSTYGFVEALTLRYVDALIIAEDSYRESYKNYKNLVCVHNYPLISAVKPSTKSLNKHTKLVYVGGITYQRGIINLLDAVSLVKAHRPVELTMAGACDSEDFRQRISKTIEQHNLEGVAKLTGQLPFEESQKLVADADIGLVLLHPIANYLGSLPTKLFEYMSAGLPVVASNFPVWAKIIEDHKCGLTADPLNANSVAEAIIWLIDNPKEAGEMGENGRRAVHETLNWRLEEKTLLALYNTLSLTNK